MADGNGMRVDLSAMDEVIRKLWGLLGDMDKAGGKAKYETNIPSNAFGNAKFQESNDLHAAHETMKNQIESMIQKLHGLIDDFGTTTSKVRDKYNDQEHAVTQNMGGNAGTPAQNKSLA